MKLIYGINSVIEAINSDIFFQIIYISNNLYKKNKILMS